MEGRIPMYEECGKEIIQNLKSMVSILEKDLSLLKQYERVDDIGEKVFEILNNTEGCYKICEDTTLLIRKLYENYLSGLL